MLIQLSETAHAYPDPLLLLSLLSYAPRYLAQLLSLLIVLTLLIYVLTLAAVPPAA